MPVDLLSSLTFGQHLLRFAERVNLADQAGTVAGLPTNEHDLDKLARYFNDGYQEFLRFDPLWSFCSESVVIATDAAGTGPMNVGGDAARYRLPPYIAGMPRTNYTFDDADAPYTECVVLAEDAARKEAQRRRGGTGTPRFCGHRPLSTGDAVEGQEHGWEVFFAPAPDRTYTLRATFRIDGHILRDLGERTVAGGAHDNTILACAVHEWAQFDQTMADRLATLRDDRDRKLLQSQALDRKMRARRRGSLPVRDGSGETTPRRVLVTQHNSGAIAPLGD